jgi:hypothetical protein
VVHAAFNLGDFATLVTIPAIAADAIDEVGPRGVKLGVHVLRDAELRHDLECWRAGGPVVTTRLPLESDQIGFPGAAGIVGPTDPQQKRVPLALGTEDVTVASIGERHGRDEVTYALIVSPAEPVDLDGLPTV